MVDRGGGDSFPVGPHFNLSDEILSVIPTDPYDLLDLACKISSIAIASKVTKLEAEADHLHQKIQEKDRTIAELGDRVSQLEAAYQEIELRLKISREDNIKLQNEKNSLALTAEKLRHNLARLQNFKRQLLQSINDEDSSPQTESVDFVPKAYATAYEDNSIVYTSGYSDSAAKMSGHRWTPKVMSSAGSSQRTSGTTSPSQYEELSSVSLQYSSSQQSSGATSPTRGYPSPLTAPNRRTNGKEFFRLARNRLSLEQFSAFLANIKEVNAQRQSFEETLRKAEVIFGMDNRDLYVLFQGLLNYKHKWADSLLIQTWHVQWEKVRIWGVIVIVSQSEHEKIG